jgi:hypothetical protein
MGLPDRPRANPREQSAAHHREPRSAKGRAT